MIDLADLAKRAGGTFDGRNALIPGPGHSDADRSLSVSIGGKGKLIWNSFAGDDNASVRAYLKSLGVDVTQPHVSPDPPDEFRASPNEAPQKTSTTAQFAGKLWAECIPIVGTIAAEYLRQHRGINPPYPASIRFHPNCPDGPFRRPALIAARTLIDAPNKVASVQRTFLRKDGAGKADIAESKKTLGACKGGGVVFGEIDTVLLVAEGIETGLSAAAMFNMPAVATLGTAFTCGLIVPMRVRQVLIAADNDVPGMQAAHTLAARLRREGRDVLIEVPPPSFNDFNDLANGKGARR